MTARPSGRSFWGQLRAAVPYRDVVAVLSVPILLGLVFLLPLASREALSFQYTDPSLLAAFTANYVHLDFSHLLVNLGIYALVVPTVYLLAVLGGHRREFFIVFTTFLFVFPFVLSGLNLAFVRPGISVGFSGINMAFVGYLPLALARFLTAQSKPLASDIAGGGFFIGLAVVAVQVVQSPEVYALAVAALLAALLYWLPVFDDSKAVFADLRTLMQTPGYPELATVGVITFAGLAVLAFPADTAAEAGVVNLYEHLLGYALGFIVVYVTAELEPRLSGQRGYGNRSN